MSLDSLKLTIVADWLPTYGGAEHVLSALHTLWPNAPIFTSVARRSALGPLRDADIRTDSFLQRAFHIIGRHQYLLPWMPRAFESLDLDDYDVVLTSSHAVSKGVIPSNSSVHVCYCHTPMRYAWEMEEEYFEDFKMHGLRRWLAKRELKKLRRFDLSTAKRVDVFIANSSETQERIKRIYGRDSVVVHPPVDARFFQVPLSSSEIPKNPSERTSVRAGKNQNPSYFLAIGRLVPYKRFDLLIELANKLQLPLKIAGVGSDFARLKSLAGPTVTFLGHIADADLPRLYANAQCLLFPQIEDAGIVPLEAQASGIPVIAYGKGGVRDVVVNGETGLLLNAQTVDAFVEGIAEFQKTHWNREAIREYAKKFHIDVFQKRMKEEIESAVKKFQ